LADRKAWWKRFISSIGAANRIEEAAGHAKSAPLGQVLQQRVSHGQNALLTMSIALASQLSAAFFFSL
jgi:hypothetical protein